VSIDMAGLFPEDDIDSEPRGSSIERVSTNPLHKKSEVKLEKDESFPLHRAVERGDAAAVRALILNGVDLNQTDGFGHTAAFFLALLLRASVGDNALSLMTLGMNLMESFIELPKESKDLKAFAKKSELSKDNDSRAIGLLEDNECFQSKKEGLLTNDEKHLFWIHSLDLWFSRCITFYRQFL